MIYLKQFFQKINIKQILLVGLFLRLLAVFFSRGYGFHDDHFEVIELAWKWKDGLSFTWDGGPVHLFSLIYPGMHYLIIGGCEMIGIDDPQKIMIIVRLIHALVSMAGVYYAYKITLRLTDNISTANMVALTMAALYILPFLSVRSLREVFCIPFMLAATYHIVSKKVSTRQILYAAFLFDIAFCIRMQTVLIPIGLALYWVFTKGNFKTAILFGLSMIACFFLTQGLFDLIHYGNPFASSMAYVKYNSNPENLKGYPQGPFIQYIGTIALFTLGLPFISLLIGYIKSAWLSPRIRMLFVSSLLFFAFHSYLSSKQDRFILPFLPYFLILGIIGFIEFYRKRGTSKWISIPTKLILIWFLILNTCLLILLCFTYSKKVRVESMSYLRSKGNVSNIIIEGSGTPPPPLFYLGKHLPFYEIDPQKSDLEIKSLIDSSGNPKPNYLIMAGKEDFEMRLKRMQLLFPGIVHDTDIVPGFIDNLMYKINPKHNKNEVWHIYKL